MHSLAGASGTKGSSRFSYGIRGLVIVLLVFEVTIEWLSSRLNLYIDELYSLHTTASGFKAALEQSIGFEQQPPLYFIALTAWRRIDSSDFFARQFSIACSILTLFLAWRFARQFVPAVPAWVFALIIATNPVFIWAALDIRVYALVILLSAALVLLFMSAFLKAHVSPIALFAFTAIATIGIYTQYFIGSLFIGFALVLVVNRQPRRLLLFVASMLLVSIIASPLLAVDLSHELRQATAVEIVPPVVVAERMLASMLGFVFPHYWTSGISRIAILMYGLLVLALTVMIVRATRPGPDQRTLALILLGASSFFVAIILIVRVPLEMPRHIAVLFIPTTFLMASLFALPADTMMRRCFGVFAAASIIFSLATDAKSYRPPFTKVGDWERVGAFLTAHVAPSESIAVFDTEDVLAVNHYYRGDARVIAIPSAQNFRVFDRRAFAIQGPAVLHAVFPPVSASTGRTWLVFGDTACGMVEIGDSCAVLNSYLAAHFRIVESERFDGTVVDELTKR